MRWCENKTWVVFPTQGGDEAVHFNKKDKSCFTKNCTEIFLE